MYFHTLFATSKGFLIALSVGILLAAGMAATSDQQANAALGSTGQWSEVFDWPLVPIHAALTPDGNVLSYGTTRTGEQSGQLDYDVWNPLLGTGLASHSTRINGTSTDLFCSTQVIDPIRDVIFTAGGDDGNYGSSFGASTTTSYSTEQGLKIEPSMKYKRWYPTAVTLTDGDLLIQGGSTEGIYGEAIKTPERFNVNTGWTELTGAHSEYAFGSGGDQYRWWYPRSWVAPDGDVFGYGGSNMYSLDPSGDGSVTALGTLPGQNIGASSTAVMYRPGKILQIGGGAFHTEDWSFTASTAVTTIDINNATPVVTSAAPLQQQRHWGTATVLPDGDVLVTGGSAVQNSVAGPVAYQPELWDPDTNTWTTLSAGKRTRLYHSIALLLPDGRVLVGGGGQPGPELNLNAEIFSPPYLFNGDQPAARPRIETAPDTIRYGEKFDVTVSSDVVSVSLIRAGAVTHSFNSGTRYMDLEISGSGANRSIKAPATAAVAPPGTYMLFAMNAAGTPSVSALIDIDPGDPVDGGNQNLVGHAASVNDIVRADDYDPIVHGLVLRYYHAFFGRAPDPAGASYWLQLLIDNKTDLAGATHWFANPQQSEFAAQYADISESDHAGYLRRVYQNMLGRQPDETGFQYWKNLMDTGQLDRAQVVRWVSVNQEFVERFPYPAS